MPPAVVLHFRTPRKRRALRADSARTRAQDPLDPSVTESDVAGAKRCAATLAGTAKTTRADGKGESVEAYSVRWLADRAGRVQSVEDDRARIRMHVLPMLGALEARKFDRDDVERLRDDLDDKIMRGTLAWKTVASVWTLVTSMCADMVTAKKREFRVRDENPCRDVKPPERGDRKAKQYLYPSEFLKFVSCEPVPLQLRRALAISVYTFVRAGELRALRWDGGDVDLEHGTLSITRALGRDGVVKSTESGRRGVSQLKRTSFRCCGPCIASRRAKVALFTFAIGTCPATFGFGSTARASTGPSFTKEVRPASR